MSETVHEEWARQIMGRVIEDRPRHDAPRAWAEAQTYLLLAILETLQDRAHAVSTLDSGAHNRVHDDVATEREKLRS